MLTLTVLCLLDRLSSLLQLSLLLGVGSLGLLLCDALGAGDHDRVVVFDGFEAETKSGRAGSLRRRAAKGGPGRTGEAAAKSSVRGIGGRLAGWLG